MTNKIISLILTVVLLLSLIPCIVSAAVSPSCTICADTVWVDLSQTTVDVPIKISNNPGVASMGLYVEFDASAMVYTGISDGLFKTSTSSVWVNDTQAEEGILYVSVTQAGNVTGDGDLFVLSFELIGEVTPGNEYIVSIIKDDTDFGGVYNESFEQIEYEVEDGYILIDYPTGDIDEVSISFFDKDGNFIIGYETGIYETVVLPEAPEVPGYTFIGWLLESSWGEDGYIITEDFEASSDCTLTATYEKNEPLFTIIPGDVTAYDIDETVEVAINFENNPGVTNLGFEVLFDASALTYKSVTCGDIFSEAEILFGETKVDEGSLFVSAYNGTVNKTNNGTLLTFTFELADGVKPGDYEIAIVKDEIFGGVYNVADEEIPYEVKSGIVTVKEKTYTVTFLDMNGEIIGEPDVYVHDTLVTLPEAPEVANHTFLGWSTGVDGEELITESFIATCDLTLTAVYERNFIPGDVNGDGRVDRKDLNRLAQYFARWEVEIESNAADANGDGRVDRKDLNRLAQYFARWEVELGR